MASATALLAPAGGKTAAGEEGEKHRGEDANDGYDHEQFDECESFFVFHL